MPHVRSLTLRRIAAPVFGLALLCGALWLLHRELSGYTIHEVRAAMHAVPTWRIALALALTAINYVVRTGYDVLALR